MARKIYIAKNCIILKYKYIISLILKSLTNCLDSSKRFEDNPFASTTTGKISWYKDGVQINRDNLRRSSRIQIYGSRLDQLKINSVRPEDVGLYQCFLTTHGNQEFQAASEIRLGGKEFCPRIILIICI